MLGERELAVYGGALPKRRVSARLRHPAAPSSNGGRPWTFRLAECDIADHVNNAAYRTPLEEELLAGPEPEQIDVELEYRSPSQAGDKQLISQGEAALDRRCRRRAATPLMMVRNGSGG